MIVENRTSSCFQDRLGGRCVPLAGGCKTWVEIRCTFGQQAYFLNFPSKFISDDGKSMWLCYSANYSNGWNGVELEFNRPGGRYGHCLHEVKLLTTQKEP